MSDDATDETPVDIPEGSESPEDVQRRKFREALAKKEQAHHGGGAPAGPIQQAHTGPAVNKRVHRRKSG